MLCDNRPKERGGFQRKKEETTPAVRPLLSDTFLWVALYFVVEFPHLSSLLKRFDRKKQTTVKTSFDGLLDDDDDCVEMDARHAEYHATILEAPFPREIADDRFPREPSRRPPLFRPGGR
jgi:hypothetical protein